VKNDRDREFYLGHSVKASTGRQALAVLSCALYLWHVLQASWLSIVPASACDCVSRSPSRWQKGKDILWYTREKKGDEVQQRADELTAIKAREEDLMAEVLHLRAESLPC